IDVSAEHATADLLVLASATLERVLFTSCNLSQSDFQQARLRAVTFEDCDLRGADLSNAHFADVELNGCRLDGLRGATNLRGVRMRWSDVIENAVVFADACGVEIVED